VSTSQLYGADVSVAKEPMFVKIVNLPARGTLYYKINGKAKNTVGQVLPLSGLGSTTPRYLSL
jgi:hypothetical protein